MKKFALSITACTMLAAGLAGCGGNNNAAEPIPDRVNYDMNYVNDYRGADHDYEMTRANRGDRGEGPITDMLTVDDRTTRTERHDSTHNVNDGMGSSWAYGNPRDVVDKDHYTQGERDANQARFQKYNGETGDHPGMVNERGQLNNDHHQGHTTKYNNSTEHDLERTIDHAVENMDRIGDSHVVVDGDHVVIAVRGSNIDDDLKAKIKNTVEDHTNKTVYVTDDDEMFGKVRNVTRDIRNAGGEMVDETRATFEDMLGDLGNMAERPFERSR
ncbi:YhcN/YlaJ family sporulation lipoprotein [Geomicrobium sediminis]|uniref:Ni/Co efflux regulator RcnB n=1 Tax=Geomicrobium sediminis TaxID=1347788 RepID=A0ABS2PET2_9BACL|nr:YhcN/YlaJ family sporulation lipoprotein [Geomicrobium sediminis]MBM7633934.1 Ni/Co efflux regulator RcnB [Geomicrobium sediminis]